ncbi:MAG: rod shape-determining protein RodA [Thermodesulfobacteriota bacterium]
MIDRRLFAQIDWRLLAVTAALAAIGLASIYSTTLGQGGYAYQRQLWWVAAGAGVMTVTVILNYSLLERFAYPIFILSVASLAATLAFGQTVGGAQRWLDLGVVSVQPSEFAKLAFIVVMARYLSSIIVPKKGLGLKDLFLPGLLLAIPFVLIVREPDLGTSLIFVLIFGSMMLTVKIKTRTLAALAVLCVTLIPFAWGSLRSYQKKRLLSFLDPASDPLGSGYHLLQSKIAIGSGGFLGKGFTKGTQASLMFLPEHHTDFILSTLAEEWGLMGSFTVLALFLALLLRGLEAAKNSKDRFGFLLALGIAAMLFWHITINIGMVSGLLPVVGVPLPFLSYGGSFLLTSLIGVGILVNIGMRRFIF